MANLVASQVTILRAWTEGGVSGKERKGMGVKIETSASPGQGGATNQIVASAFGLQAFESCSNFVWNTSGFPVIPAVVSPTGSAIWLINVGDPTDATRATPADHVSAELYGEVKGY